MPADVAECHKFCSGTWMKVDDTGLVFLRLKCKFKPLLTSVFSDINGKILPVLQYWGQSNGVGIN